jgi:predicted metalloendopeptidase
VLTDEHAPGKFRVIGGLTQFKPFAEAFQCPEGSPMAPEDKTRCHLW